MPKSKNFNDLLTKQLKDIYSAEIQLTRALPTMARAATDAGLKAAFAQHLVETRTHLERLLKIFSRLGTSPRGTDCKPVKALIEEGNRMIKVWTDPAVRDASLIAAAQCVEHYKIASYGCARTFADVLGDPSTADTLQFTFEEKVANDTKLLRIACGLNVAARSAAC